MHSRFLVRCEAIVGSFLLAIFIILITEATRFHGPDLIPMNQLVDLVAIITYCGYIAAIRFIFGLSVCNVHVGFLTFIGFILIVADTIMDYTSRPTLTFSLLWMWYAMYDTVVQAYKTHRPHKWGISPVN